MKKVYTEEATPTQLDWLVHQLEFDHNNDKDSDQVLAVVCSSGEVELWHRADVYPHRDNHPTPAAWVNGQPVTLSGSPADTYTRDWCTASCSSGYASMGPICRREGIWAEPRDRAGTSWVARRGFHKEVTFSDGHTALSYCTQFGETPLIAQARCYVLSMLGNVVEVPKELS